MKSDTERKKYHSEKLHKRKSRLHVHLSKELRSKLKAKKRSLLVRKGDTVRVMRGPGKGKEAKVARVNTIRRKVFVEDVAAKSARGKEVPVALEPSNLLLTALESTPERKEIFSEDAFRKKEAHKKAEKKEEAPKHEHAKGEKPEHKPAEHKAHEAKPEHKHEEKKHEHAKHDKQAEAPKPPAQR